ncbi:MAG TPA: DegV family protein [Calditerricola sp.]
MRHAAEPEEAAALRERALSMFHVAKAVDVAEIGPVVGTHVGPGTLAVSRVTG